jgi:hypothetical protein
MLDLLARIEPSDRAALQHALTTHLRALSAPGPRNDRRVVAQVEAEVRADPGACLRFDPTGLATLEAAGRTFKAGRFETPRLGALRRRAEEAKAAATGSGGGSLRFFVLDGASPATDIGALQATAPEGSLFQVASQFNCLESPDACVADVADYLHDPTQGPRASISAFPGTFVRHYAAPAGDGTRIVQRTDGPQINLLEELCADGAASVTSGYLMTNNIPRPADFARALEERFDEIHTGLHDGVEVVLGHDWDGPVPGAPGLTIAHVLCSTVAAGGYSRVDPRDPAIQTIIRQLQRAAHLGALVSAAALGKSYAVLTLVGGGVFGNPVRVIWESILWALDAVRPLLHRDLCVAVNGYSLGRHVPRASLAEAAAARGGALIVFDRTSVSVGEAP